ncbi:alpha/beta hydrolase [Nitrosopumilus sp.]|uniref:alpha/beta fold hydrolase n=1 Tax=Nitrosopumilus sp. TaxID=2024843 RepID=UPI00292CB04A|nr:alpha/beta hydrolase [Nitrosopumilus sp.]
MKKNKMRVKRFFKYFGIAIAILIMGFLIVAQIAYQSIPQIEPPGKMYPVNGEEIHMYCTGPEDNSKPTIIIISGGSTPSFVYFDLQEKLSETVRTCTYDTAGNGWSPANDIPYTTKNLSNELYLLLQSAKIDGPIILAGHSLGGIVSLIYSAEHEEQVAGIAFIDSSHYNQYDYFGKEYRDATFNQIEEYLPYVWLIELRSNLGVSKLMAIFDTSMSEEQVEEHSMLESIHRWNSPYSTMKSMASNLKLSFEQGKEVHYDRGDLPIIVLSAGSPVVSDSQEIEGISTEEFRKGFDILQKDLAGLSSNGKHVFVNGTNHGSIVYNDETADHILSLIPLIEEK